jgi:hypothetical protein
MQSDPLNFTPHIDCFQTWADSSSEVGSNIIFEQNYCKNLNMTAEGWMLGGGTNNLTIRNNIVWAYRGVNTGDTGENHLYFYNNTWINDPLVKFDASAALILYDVPYSVIENNIFYNQSNLTVAAIGNVTGDVIDYNLAFNDSGNAPCIKTVTYSCMTPAPVHSKWNVNPLFVGASDFHLQSNSPAIDAGITIPITNDFDGNARPQGSSFDIGAYEFVVISTPTPTPTNIPTSTSTPTLTPSNTPTLTPTPTFTFTPTPTFTLIPTSTPTYTLTFTPTPTSTPTPECLQVVFRDGVIIIVCK